MQKCLIDVLSLAKLVALPSKQLQLYFLMLLVADDSGTVYGKHLYEGASNLRLKASRMSGNLAALAKRRLIIVVGEHKWQLNDEVATKSGTRFKLFAEVETEQANNLLDQIRDKYGFNTSNT